jgi:GDPmannose 4,6-dehydratase
VEAMHLMLQQSLPDDFVISSGQTHSVKSFLAKAFSLVNLDWNDYVVIDPSLYRPCEVEFLKGDCSKAKSLLGWNTKISFDDLVKDMVLSDINKYKNVS